MSTITFEQFQAEQEARNSIQLKVTEWCLELCDSLTSRAPENHFYQIESGKKYHKVIMYAYGSRSVHAFIDKKTGEVYKPASWKSPAKGVRYDLRLIHDRNYLFTLADWAGAYLYMK